MAEEDESQKTEEPTAKRLEEALKKGNVASSQEFKTWFLFLFATAAVAGGAPWLAEALSTLLHGYLGRMHEISVTESGVFTPIVDLVIDWLLILAIPLAIFVIAAIVGNVVQHPFVFSLEKVKPDLSKVNPISGIKKRFSSQVVVDFIKNLAKLILVTGIVFLIIWPERDRLDSIMLVDTLYVLSTMHDMAIAVMLGVLIFMTFVAALDFTYVKWKFNKDMRMTKQEVKDERKQTDGDPLVKGKIRSLRMERARSRMMANVPNADVVVTNPTHYAIALEYKHGVQDVPVLLAKGIDEVALRIRELAEDYNIPVVENPPLARALYASVEIDEEIPPNQYKAVAEVISYVMKLRKSGLVRSR